VSIDQGCLEIPVAKQLLNRPDIVAISEQVGGEAVTLMPIYLAYFRQNISKILTLGLLHYYNSAKNRMGLRVKQFLAGSFQH